MKVSQIMTQPAVVVHEEATLAAVARLMLEQRIGCLPVVDALGKLRGIITESNFMMEERFVPFSAYQCPQLFGERVSKEALEQIYETGRRLTARAIMRTPVVTVQEDDTIRRAAELMLHHGVHHLPVVRDGVPVGVVARHDMLRVMVQDEAPG